MRQETIKIKQDVTNTEKKDTHGDRSERTEWGTQKASNLLPTKAKQRTQGVE